jgi:hypothetical protein
MILNKTLVTTFLVLISSQVFSASLWEHIDTIKGTEISVDKNSIRKFSDNLNSATHQVWIRYLVVEDVEKDKLKVGDYRMNLVLIHCENNTMGTKSATVYYNLKNGIRDAKSASHPFVKMEDIVPNSIGGKISEIVCHS